MPLSGVYYRMKTYANGTRVRLAISPSGRILEATPVKSRRTRTGRRLARRLRRLHR